MANNDDQLKQELSKLGTIQLFKKGYVFTLLMTGENLSNWKVASDIQIKVAEHVGDQYPTIECISNDENHFCIILKPN